VVSPANLTISSQNQLLSRIEVTDHPDPSEKIRTQVQLSKGRRLPAGDYSLKLQHEAGAAFVMAFGKAAKKNCTRCDSQARIHFRQCCTRPAYNLACANCLMTNYPEHCSFRTPFLPLFVVRNLTCNLQIPTFKNLWSPLSDSPHHLLFLKRERLAARVHRVSITRGAWTRTFRYSKGTLILFSRRCASNTGSFATLF
jgi:hypothetical protein